MKVGTGLIWNLLVRALFCMNFALFLVFVAGLLGNKYSKSGFSERDLANFAVMLHLLVSSETKDNSRNLSSYESLLELPIMILVARH